MKFKIAGLLKWKHNYKRISNWNLRLLDFSNGNKTIKNRIKILSKHKEYNIKIKSEDNDKTFIVRVTNLFPRMDQTVKNHGLKNACTHQNYKMMENQMENYTLENDFENNNCAVFSGRTLIALKKRLKQHKHFFDMI